MKDLRKDFDWNFEGKEPPEGHRKRFEIKLPHRQKQIPWLKIAALLIIALLSSVIIYQNSYWFTNEDQIVESKRDKNNVNLNKISPKLATLENYYETSIQLQIAELQESEKFEEVFDAYFEELHLLELDYRSLKKKLITVGDQESIILSLIENLQLRLELMQNLEQHINELKQQENENYQSNNM